MKNHLRIIFTDNVKQYNLTAVLVGNTPLMVPETFFQSLPTLGVRLISCSVKKRTSFLPPIVQW